MKKILLTPIIFALFVMPCLAQQAQSLSDDDYAQVVKAILLDKRLDERTVLSKKERAVAYLSTENISQKLVPAKIKGVKIEIKTPQQIEERKKKWRNYLVFGKFETNGSTITVNVHNYWREIDADEFDVASVKYEYRKIHNKWEFVSKRFNVSIALQPSVRKRSVITNIKPVSKTPLFEAIKTE